MDTPASYDKGVAVNRMTEEVRHRVGESREPLGAARILVIAHPDDQPELLDRIAGLLLAQQNCIVYWFATETSVAEDDATLTHARIAEVVGDMQLVVALVTRRMLLETNPAMDEIVPYALEHNVAVLPLLMEQEATLAYPRRFGDLQYLMPDDPDRTALPFEQKLASYLAEVLVSDDVAQQVRNAFDALVFLSYRKSDRAYAAELMRMIHRSERFRDIAFWYDEFLVPGEDFNDGIRKALDMSDLFALVVTPRLLERPNYVLDYEYPAAQDAHKAILPVMMSQLSDEEAKRLAQLYRRIPRRIDATEGALPDDRSVRQLRRLATRTAADDVQHTFLIGLAYLDGINMEVDYQRAIALITEAAEAGLEEAMRKLSTLYRTGKGVRRSVAEAVAWQRKLCDVLYERYRKDESDEDLTVLCREQSVLANLLFRAKKIPDLYGCLWEQRRWAEEELRRGFAGGRHDLAVCLCKLAEICTMIEQSWEGVQYCWEAVAHFEVLLEQEPADAARRDAYIACRKLGQIYALRKEWADTLGMYRLARERLELVEDPAYRDSLRRDEAALWRLEGDALRWLQQTDEAAACYERAREVSEAAYARRPDTVSRRSLINTYDKLVIQRRRAGQHDVARAYLRRELELVEEELAEARENGLRLNALYVELADLHEMLGEGPEAIRCYRACLDTPEEDPDSAQSRETRVDALRALARLSREAGLPERAVAFFQQMTDTLRQLYADTRAPEYLDTLARELDREADRHDGEVAGIRLLEEAFDVRQQIVTQVYSLDTKARRDLLRDRLDRLYQQYPEARRPWVILCESSDASREGMAACLEQCGCRVALSMSYPRDLTRLFTEVRPDLMILGLQVYYASVLDELRFLCRTLDRSAKVIVVVDEGADDAAARAREAGATDVLHRPVTAEALEQAVRIVLPS